LSPLRAAFVIAGQAALYRIRKREANNLVSTVSLMVAFQLPLGDMLYRTVWAVLLNLYIYLMNDYCDIERDLGSPQKDHAKARFMADNRHAARGALLGMGAILLVGAMAHSPLLAMAFVANTVVVWCYSAWFKQVPILDVVLMFICGITISLPGLPEHDPLGLKVAAILGLICASFEVIQVMRDEPGDRAAGVTTTAVLLGRRFTAWLFKAIVVAAAAYVSLWVGSLLGVILLAALLFPLTPERADRTWDLCRVLFGAVWFGVLVQVYLGSIA